RPDGVPRVWRYDGHTAGPGDLSLPADRDLETALDDVPDLFVRVGVLVDRRPRRDGVVPEGHAARVEVASFRPGQGLFDGQLIRIDEGHLAPPIWMPRSVHPPLGDHAQNARPTNAMKPPLNTSPYRSKRPRTTSDGPLVLGWEVWREVADRNSLGVDRSRTRESDR